MGIEITCRTRSTLRQILVAFTVGLGNLVISATLGFPSPALPQMQKDPSISISEEQGSWMASILPASAIVGCLWASYLVDVRGRKYVLMMSMFNFMISWIGIGAASNVYVIILLRFYAGVCLGLQSTAGAVYYAEMIETDLKPSLGIFAALLGTLGSFFISCCALIYDWRVVAFIGGILCIPQLVCLIFLPESPNFLFHSEVKKGRMAMETFVWLLPSVSEAKLALAEMKNSIKLQNEQAAISLKDLWKPSNRLPISISLLLHIFQQTTAINIFMFFSTTIFAKVDGVTNPESWTIAMAAVNVVSNVFSIILQSICLRKTLLEVSSVFIIPMLWIISLYFYLEEHYLTNVYLEFMSPIFLLVVMVYIIAFAVGWGPVPFLFLSEGLPSNIRGKGSGIALALNWGMTFLVTKTFFWMSDKTGFGFVFFSYGIITAVGIKIMDMYMPETFGLTSYQMDSYYASKKHKLI